MSRVRAFVAGSLLLGACALAVFPFTLRTVPPTPDRPVYGPGATNTVKHKPGDRVPVYLNGPPSVKGLRQVTSLVAQLRSEKGPPIEVPIEMPTGEKNWEDTIAVQKPYVTAPITITTLAGPLPAAPQLAGRQVILNVEASVVYPNQVAEQEFEEASGTLRELMTLTFFAAGEFEAREQQNLADAQYREEFAQWVRRKQRRLWSAAAFVAVAAMAILILPTKPGSTARGPQDLP